jgi:transcriptional regulator with XRE-family HTH domain
MDMTGAALIRQARQRAGLTQAELARQAGTSQPAVARLEAGLTSPTLETMARLTRAAGFVLDLRLAPSPVPDALVEAYKRDVDRTLLRRNLGKTVDERLRALVALQRSAAELRRAGARASKRR